MQHTMAVVETAQSVVGVPDADAGPPGEPLEGQTGGAIPHHLLSTPGYAGYRKLLSLALDVPPARRRL